MKRSGLPADSSRFFAGFRLRPAGIYGARFFLVIFAAAALCISTPDLGAQSSSGPGDAPERGNGPMAERYALWIKNILDQGRYDEALSALERASDFADVSSDISYMLALVRDHKKKPRVSVLEALTWALSVNRWKLYSAADARFLLAETLVALRAYSGALTELFRADMSSREAEICLKAIMRARPADFRRFMTETLDRYPRETGPARILLEFLRNENLAGRNPGEADLELLELVLRRLPVLLPKDAELAWMAAPFMRDIDAARRLVMAYRAINAPVRESLPVALRLGVIDEESALEELFGSPGENPLSGPGPAPAEPLSLDIALLGEVWDLLRREEARALFRRNLSAYTGVITEDADRDGLPETGVEYREGLPLRADYDTLQERIPLLSVYFETGIPLRALTLIPPEDRAERAEGEASWYTGNRKEAALFWERYPALREINFDGADFLFRPMAFSFSPILFDELWGSGVLFPRRDSLSPPLGRRTIVINAGRVERSSREFDGGREVVELARGIPIQAREYLGELEVSETEFLRGRPQIQRVDLDLDGRKETVRFFARDYPAAELEELWDYDRNIERTARANDWDE